MKAKKLVLLGLVVAALLAASAGAGWSWAQELQTRSTAARPFGTAFTYQGRLTDGDAPADGRYDLRFQLWDAGSGGNPVGSPVDFEDHPIRDGLFTGLLDFQGGAFNGDGRWLAVGIRPWDSKAHHEFLEPRQQLTAAPYALFAKTIYRQTIVVKPAGAPTENGVSLIGALAAITDASADKPYLLKLEPGLYDIGNLSLVMKEYVDIEGSGMDATVISGTGGASAADGTVWGADHAELRFLTVRNEGGHAAWATALYLKDTSPRITDVQALASDAGSAVGIRIEGSHPTLTRVTAVADGTDLAAGIYTLAFSHPTLEDVTGSARGATLGYGLYHEDSYPTLREVFAFGRATTAAYGVYNLRCMLAMIMDGVEAYAYASDIENAYGVYNDTDSNPAMTDVFAYASNSGGDNAYGLYNNSSSPAMHNVVATAQDADNNYGLLNNDSSPEVNGLTATASGGTIAYGIKNENSSSVILTNIVAEASGGTGSNYGLGNVDSNATVNSSTLTASGTATTNAALKNQQASSFVNNSTLRASGATLNIGMDLSATGNSYKAHLSNSQIMVAPAFPTLRTDDEFSILIGASLLSGGNIDNQGGNLKCAGVYDEAYDFYPSTCP